MPLFVHLSDKIFLPFSRGNKYLYEVILTVVYEKFYRDAPRFPRRGEVIAEIYDLLRARPDLADDEAPLAEIPEVEHRGRRRMRVARGNEAAVEIGDEILKRARLHYDYLIESGWLEEDKFGVQVTVDMTPGGLALLEALYRIREGFSLHFSGTLVQLNLMLDGITREPYRNALSLDHVRRSLESFVRHLRAIISDLKRIKAEMAAGDSQQARLHVFVKGFVERLLLKDFAALHESNHPYRYKSETLVAVRRLSSDPAVLRAVGRAYAEHDNPDLIKRTDEWEVERQAAIEAGIARVDSDFSTILAMLGHIDEMFERIRTFQVQLEGRIRNMLRYKNKRRMDLGRRSEETVDRLVAWIGRNEGKADQPLVDGYLADSVRPFGPALHGTPRRERVGVQAAEAVVRMADPVDLFLQELKSRHLHRLWPDDERLGEFLESALGDREEVAADRLVIDDIDDFLALDAVLLLMRRRQLPPTLRRRYRLEPLPGTLIDNPYMRCENFLIKRRNEGGSHAA
ncbi:Wadjet anti-phage system protein JetA family protein [Microvirga massiliensis]|uniref:Wadjet anti-phage system protein JetA family protein n=1 Tax=Microvirga massiliensis TaxID=1033741 RepID=UPI00062B71D1|nr:Wadjet anti-phage system protein JetA family protein [Microvirga massiliensis]